MFELSKRFLFDSSHTLDRVIETESSRRYHGHSYRAMVTVRGTRDANGMLIDLGLFERAMADTRLALNGLLLDDVPGLGPATMENLCAWIWRDLEPKLPGLHEVGVYRDSSGDACRYWGE